MPSPFFSGLRCASFALFALTLAAVAADEPLVVKMSVLPGLKFDQTRFAAKPGQKVTIKLQNPDQMIHNLVITEPGARAEVVTAALALGADGPAKNFIPETKKVLHSTKAINPGETTELTFTAPETEGVYPYVCTSMGHGFVMYGAMYVTTKALPPLESDPNVPPAAVAVPDSSDFSHTIPDRPVVSRTFLPDCGPAAIAVGLPGGQSYVFDAGLCRLRYAWKGGFVDNREHWSGKGDVFGRVVGRVYYRAPEEAMIRIGEVASQPAARWKGYEIAKDGTPTFHYTLDGCDVSETPQMLTDQSGISFKYSIDSHGAGVYFVTDARAGANLSSSAGEFQRGIVVLDGSSSYFVPKGKPLIFPGRVRSDLENASELDWRCLALSAAQAREFTVTLTEIPKLEPLVYWSMNDLPFVNQGDPLPGMVGRAFTPGGTDSKRKATRLFSGVRTSELREGGTLMAWVKLGDAKTSAAKLTGPEPVFSAGDSAEGYLLKVEGPEEKWVHLALVINAQGRAKLYRNGSPEEVPDFKLPEGNEKIYIGSVGDKHYLRGLIDEVRIYDRPLEPMELQMTYVRESNANPNRNQ